MADSIAFKIKILGALSVGDARRRPIPSLLSSQNHYLKSYIIFRSILATRGITPNGMSGFDPRPFEADR